MCDWKVTPSRQRKHLKTTAIRKYWSVPAVEFVQSANGLKHLQARAQIQMIGVAQNDLRLDLVAHVADMAGLHRARRAYRHVPAVPTGMKMGVSIGPWPVCNTPARALLFKSLETMSKFIALFLCKSSEIFDSMRSNL